MKKRSVPVVVASRQHPFAEWLKLSSFLMAWAAREHHLNLQALSYVPVASRERDAHRAGMTRRVR